MNWPINTDSTGDQYPTGPETNTNPSLHQPPSPRRIVCNAARKATPLKVDPTRLGGLRRSFAAEVRRRFTKLRQALSALLVTEDALGLKGSDSGGEFAKIMSPGTSGGRRWSGLSLPDRARAFESWMSQAVQAAFFDRAWWESFSADAYLRGLNRAYDEVMGKGDLFSHGFLSAKAEFLRGVLRRGRGGGLVGNAEAWRLHSNADPLRDVRGRFFSVEQQALSLRLEREVRGVATKVLQDVSRLVLTALEMGWTPTHLAIQVRRTVDSSLGKALAVAETELTRAHAEAQLDGMEELGVEGVTAAAEWDTAGDDRVCDLCQPMEGAVLTPDEARGMIPRHFRCRCAWTPTTREVAREAGKSVSRSSVEGAIRRSVRAEGGPAKSDWVGKDAEIKKRK